MQSIFVHLWNENIETWGEIEQEALSALEKSSKLRQAFRQQLKFSDAQKTQLLTGQSYVIVVGSPPGISVRV